MRYFLLLISLSFSLLSSAQKPFKTETFDDRVHTLCINKDGDYKINSITSFNKDIPIVISFDLLDDKPANLTYTISHCNADWTLSNLSPVEYLNGIRTLSLEDYAFSFNTTVNYINYRIELPNQNQQFKISGNYVVSVYDQKNPKKPILTACFTLVEDLVKINASVSSKTDIDFSREHQQLSFSILNDELPIRYPERELKTVVIQNRRIDNVRYGVKPSRYNNSKIDFEYNKDLIFEAGNEYRRFEFLSHKYNGMGIEQTFYKQSLYNICLFTDIPRDRKAYQYDQDQNGSYIIKCNNCNEYEIEADYFVVHFNLKCDKKDNGDLYLNGSLLNGLFNPSTKMNYNEETGCYEKRLLLKQGNYNYQYLFVPYGSEIGSTAPIEGNYYQTENEYEIIVYYRPLGEQYDRAIGYKSIHFQ